MNKLLWIGVAGAAGAISRTLIGQLVFAESGFPLSTFLVNSIGTFLLCFIVSGAFRKRKINKEIEDAVTIGFLGSFTTFSALSMETVLLVENGQLFIALLYVSMSILIGSSAGLLGFHFGGKRVAE